MHTVLADTLLGGHSPCVSNDGPEAPNLSGIIGWYDANANRLGADYELVAPGVTCAWFAPLLPASPGLVIDVGAGTGRDAAWFADLGHDVVAIEPSSGLRDRGQCLHPTSKITWLDDRLPSLGRLLELNLAADVVLVSAVWQHVRSSIPPMPSTAWVGVMSRGSTSPSGCQATARAPFRYSVA